MTLPTPLELSAAGTGLAVLAGLVVWLLKDLKLALYLGLAAGACYLASGVALTYKRQGIDAQKADDAPIIQAANDRAATAAKAKDTALADLANLRNAYAAQDHGLAELQTQADAATARANAAVAGKDAAVSKYETARLAFAVAMSTPSKPEESCANADSALRRLSGLVRDGAQ
jgi:hypothetical protein